ncbi:N-acetylmuramic acid 6-phosphate [Basidiobolus meristosporus CBS 931.73]|uniref:N-acetylmuramic acid 6-phosphate n=1 Tax=Basidiobolus meristosporus CBS 931.73 TaxID=1314790 RepID=A0A1Y1XSA1_9FUNG|nr:N-acetylmuramic acid 6-phosphate [Basidiobolus meristosporus CBS 931.73]|eukprot:ORX88603.1 N-acetylmuramic acid 6-phosphate [Basidiobolus meristosporus CBS 931.73]
MLASLDTEQCNPRTSDMDALPTVDLMRLLNNEDYYVLKAIEKANDKIAETVDAMYPRFKRGGRIIMLGAGASGRIGVTEAAEMPPTFNLDPSCCIALMAGGNAAMLGALEHLEDDPKLAVKDMENLNLTKEDTVIGLSASGRTPYVLQALSEAKKLVPEVLTVAIATNPDTIIAKTADICIEALTGPEIITGSTRLKSTSAQKLILDMITNGVMIKLGKVHGNLMVNLQPRNYKQKVRAVRIVTQASGCSAEEAERYLRETNNELAPAIVMAMVQVDFPAAQNALKHADGIIRKAVALLQQ